MTLTLRRVGLLTSAAVAVALGLTACTGGSPSSDDESTGADPKSISYLIGQPEDPATLDKVKADIAAFTEQTGIEVSLDVLPVNQLRTVLQTQLRSGDGPDVFQYDTGPGFAGVLADAGLLYDLSDAYEENEWPIFDWAKSRVTFDGEILGVPDAVESLGVFANEDVLSANGIEEPKTLDELIAANETLKGAGLIPMAFADQDGWEGGHLLSMGLASRVGADGMAALVSGEESWESQPVVDAIQTFFGDFNDKGFLPPSPAAIDYDSGNALFYSGKAAMLPTGTWLVADITNSTDFEVGFFPFPGPEASSTTFAGGLGSGTFVSADTDAPESSIALLNYLLTPEHGAWQIQELQTIPAFPVDTSQIKASPLFKQVLEQTSAISSGTADFGVNIDVLMSQQFNEAMFDNLQNVLTGGSAEDAAAAMQAAAEKG